MTSPLCATIVLAMTAAVVVTMRCVGPLCVAAIQVALSMLVITRAELATMIVTHRLASLP